MFGEDEGIVVGAPAETSIWGSIGGAITGAVTGLAQQFPAVAKDVLTQKATASATAAAADAQAKATKAETERLKAQAALNQSTAVKTVKSTFTWSIPLLVGGVGLLGFALWMRSKKK